MTELLIVGTGAMALLFGSKLAGAGVKVSFLGSWKEGISALKEKGIRVAGPEDERVYPARVFSDPAEIPQIQLALILVKSWQTERAAAQLAQVLSPEGLALLCRTAWAIWKYFLTFSVWIVSPRESLLQEQLC